MDNQLLLICLLTAVINLAGTVAAQVFFIPSAMAVAWIANYV